MYIYNIHVYCRTLYDMKVKCNKRKLRIINLGDIDPS